MTLHPVPADVVLLDQLGQPAPEVFVLELAVLALPAAGDPAGEPLGDPLPQVLGVGVETDTAAARERLQGADRRGQLHAVVRGVRLPALELGALGARLVEQDHAPATRSRVGVGAAIRVNRNVSDLRHGGRNLSPGGTRLAKKS
jgi:hypothetical protein